MNRTVLNRTLLNTSVLCQSRLNQSGLAARRGKSGGIPAAIRSAMVLWYDIARQGCTNETMQQNPVLRDLSGNGHDATCYNFGWSGMSGVGGYDFPNLEAWTKNSSVKVEVVKANKVSLSSSNGTSGIRQAFSKDTTLKLHISDINPATPVSIYRMHGGDIGNELLYTITEEGDYTVESVYNPDDQYNMILLTGEATFEQFPLYPGALISDGVDDYCLVEGLPLLNKEDGYTVIANRKWIGDVNSKSQGFVSKGSSATWVDGAFYFECVEGGGTSLFNRVFPNFNSKDGVNRIFSFTQENLTYLTSAKYNNSDIVNVGDGVDTDKLVVFTLTTSHTNFYASISLYSLLLFNRDLTAEEIEWVKTNLIEKKVAPFD